MNQLLVQLLSPSAQCPTKAIAQSAGYDIHASESTVVPSKGQAIVATGIAVAVPRGTYGRISPRSGLAAKHGIDVLAGVVDFGYTGEVKVVLVNHGGVDFNVGVGDRIAQFILERIVHDAEAVVVARLPDSERGAAGFGSTGVSALGSAERESSTFTGMSAEWERDVLKTALMLHRFFHSAE